MKTVPFALLILSALVVQSKADTTISFTGDLRTNANVTDCQGAPCIPPLTTDADYAQYAAFVGDFNVSSTSTMTAITFSYGGGTNGNGTLIAANGFEPYLSLFDASGDFLASTLNGTLCPAGANTNSGTGFCYDVGLDGGTLAAGNYQIAISAYENMSFAENSGTGTLADGFTGLGNLGDGEDLHYAFDVILSPATTSAVPEPSALPIVGALVGFGLMLLRKRRLG